MPDRPRIIIDKQTCPIVMPCQRKAFKASFERWMTETYPAADGVDWEEADVRLVATVWRWEVAA